MYIIKVRRKSKIVKYTLTHTVYIKCKYCICVYTYVRNSKFRTRVKIDWTIFKMKRLVSSNLCPRDKIPIKNHKNNKILHLLHFMVFLFFCKVSEVRFNMLLILETKV